MILASAAPATVETKPAGESRASRAAILQKALDAFREKANIPGMTAAVAFPEGEIITIYSGQADVNANIKIEDAPRMPAGSVGKTFFSALAMQLIAEGKLSLDDKIEAHLGREPWFSRLPNAKDITVRNLMNHTSGLVRYEFNNKFIDDLKKDPLRTFTPEQCIAYLFDAKAPFEAGGRFEYSDTNYIVLAMILERAAKINAYDEIGRRFIKKYNFSNTNPAVSPSMPKVAQGYAGAGNEFGNSYEMIQNGNMIINPQFEWAGGGFVTTSADLARWAKILYEGDTIPTSLQKDFYNGVPAPMLGKNTQYGLGVILWNTPDGAARGHSGFFPGYLTEVRYYKNHKLAIALQANSSDFKTIKKNPSAALKPLLDAALQN